MNHDGQEVAELLLTKLQKENTNINSKDIEICPADGILWLSIEAATAYAKLFNPVNFLEDSGVLKPYYGWEVVYNRYYW